MNNKEMIEQYNISKKTGISILLQIILMAGSMCIFIRGRLEQILYGETKNNT